MPKYTYAISTQLHVRVTVEGEDDLEASELAWQLAQGYASTLTGDSHVDAEADFDGIGAELVDEE